jgi:hypothetical protein
MVQQSGNMANEALVVEVVEWLETAAHNTDLERIARRIKERKPPFVVFRFVAHFVEGEITGIEYVVAHPVKDFQTDVGLTDQDMQLLREFVPTTPNTAIKIEFEMSGDGREMLCLSQVNYVPRGTTDQAVEELLGQMAKVFAVVGLPKDLVIEE